MAYGPMGVGLSALLGPLGAADDGRVPAGLSLRMRFLPAGDRGAVLFSWLALPAAAVVALLIGAVLMLVFGANPIDGYQALFTGAFGDSYALTSTAVKAVPLLLVGAGICIAFRANVLNIGGEGQIAMGGLAATALALAVPGLPGALLIPLTLLAGAVGGGIWGAIPGVFKAYFNVNEILSTIMLNLVAVQFMNYMLSGPLVAKSGYAVGGLIPQTQLLSSNSWLPTLVEGTQLHLGVVIAIGLAVAVYVLLWRTSFGFRIRAVGLSREASQYAGISVKPTITAAMALAGALSGVAGAMLVLGSISHRMVTDGSLTGFTGNAGFNGIVVALFAGLHPLWTIVTAFLFGGLLVGGTSMQVTTGIPSDLVTAINGLIVVLVVSVQYMRGRARARARLAEAEARAAVAVMEKVPA